MKSRRTDPIARYTWHKGCQRQARQDAAEGARCRFCGRHHLPDAFARLRALWRSPRRSRPRWQFVG